MRRKDRQVTDVQTILDIINSCKVFRVAMSHDDVPYIVPLNFGYSYDDGQYEFYFHCAREGKKLDIIKKNAMVCFEMDCGHELTTAQSPCDYGYKYSSVIGSGRVYIVSEAEEKKKILSILMKQQTGEDFSFSDKQAESVTVCKIAVTELSGKQRVK